MTRPPFPHCNRRSQLPRAFTLVELLLVISIIAIVIALVLVSVSQIQNRSRALTCLSNQRQLALANQSYAADNNGRIVSPRTDSYPPPFSGSRPVGNCWVNTNNALVDFVEQPRSLENGALWNYVDANPRAYVSPMDPTGRVRSYSLSAFIGSGEMSYERRADDWFDFPDPSSPDSPEGFRDGQFKTVAMSQIPQPSRTLFSITEEDRLNRQDGRGYNLMGWVIEVRPPTGSGGVWIDTPALWNKGRVNISYLDGSIDAPNIMYEQLSDAMASNPIGHMVTETGVRPAYRFMTSILMPGIIRPEIQ
jgi:prepilin-type N-terminal cleavage/methylation domain-containing protein